MGRMRRYRFYFCLLAVTALSLGAALERWFEGWAGNRTQTENLLQVAFGDGRKLFAKHFFAKADAYFHQGYYPTIYDNGHVTENHMAGDADETGEAREDFLGKPRDWIDAFNRHFYPSRHSHLGDAQESGGARLGSASGGDEREILPWLKLSAELDPQLPETYVVASFWLRGKLGNVNEAERFLREGLQANPGDHEILFELGRIYYENRHDPARARNVWEQALKSWRAREANKPEPDTLAYAAILNHLAMLEREQNNYPRAIQYYAALKEVSPNVTGIQAWIDYLQTNGPPMKVGLSFPQSRP